MDGNRKPVPAIDAGAVIKQTFSDLSALIVNSVVERQNRDVRYYFVNWPIGAPAKMLFKPPDQRKPKVVKGSGKRQKLDNQYGESSKMQAEGSGSESNTVEEAKANLPSTVKDSVVKITEDTIMLRNGTKIAVRALPKNSAEDHEKNEFLSYFHLQRKSPPPAEPQFKKPFPKTLDDALKNVKARRNAAKKLVPQIIPAPVANPADKRRKSKIVETAVELPDITVDNGNEDPTPKLRPLRLLSIDEIPPVVRKSNGKKEVAIKNVKKAQPPKKPAVAKRTRPTRAAAAKFNYDELMLDADE